MMVAFEGIVGFICTSIMFIPLNYIPCGEKLENGKYDENLWHCNPYSTTNHVVEYFFGSIKFIATHQRYIFLLLALFISFFFFNIFRIQTNAQCSPTHRSIADILGYFLYWLIRFIEYLDPTDMHDTPYCFYGGLAYIVMIIGVLIYLELIILNICGIQKNTDSEIEQRGTSEHDTMMASLVNNKTVWNNK